MLMGACGAEDESTAADDDGSLDSGGEQPSAAEDEAEAEAEIEDSTTGVTDSVIKIGIHAPETIGGIDIGDILGLGDLTQLYWDTVNEQGGIHGRTVEVTLADDGYDANAAQQACRDLIADDLFFTSGTSGADQIVTCANLATEAQMPYMSLGVAEAGLVDKPGYRAMTMTYDAMSELMAEYVLSEMVEDPQAPVAMVRYNSPSSEGAQSAFTDTMEELGGNVVAADAVDKQGNANELTAECVKLSNLGVEVVFMILVPTVSTQLARLCAEQGFTPRYVTVSNTLSCATEPPIGVPELSGCQSFSAVRVDTTGNPLAGEAEQAWAARFPDREPPDDLVTFWALFDIYREALDQAGPELSRVKFLETLDSMQYDNGLANPIDFDGDKIGADSTVVIEALGEAPWERELVSEWTSSFG
ncbi:MAG: ABC transporter substrate-binding protein [Nocardioides sp.]|uniref:ABC transporter substrate-binding protein n=1 Tax=Nocardioides sp. TaxID=35761 RepID=UPI0023A22489|nr:ABC transporter substrate-binding protein [Nocardioides sp.]MDE0778388.1 ABC transporter substrate-binding protein [Nocardioides sp.]